MPLAATTGSPTPFTNGVGLIPPPVVIGGVGIVSISPVARFITLYNAPSRSPV